MILNRIWVTRARPGANQTARRLTALGFEPVVAPVLAVAVLKTAEIPDHAAIAFTSMNGVAVFSTLGSRRDQRVYAVGEATAGAARAAGWTDVRTADGGGDVRALARTILAGPPDGPLLMPGARERAGDLPTLLDGQIAAIDFPVYATVPTRVAPPADVDAILIHSPRAALALIEQSPDAVANRLVVAISPAAAEPLARHGPGGLRIAAHPSEDALLAALGKPGPRV
ncbi:uroporphyrinogen-III synthase [Rhizobium sp. CRIBSB]|nr:uroporphyrinogen-III synthase [Rhizobium sp. CRIBSB]